MLYNIGKIRLEVGVKAQLFVILWEVWFGKEKILTVSDQDLNNN